VHTGVQLSTRRRIRLPVDHVPTSLREYRPSLFTFGCMWRSGCFSHKDGALRSPQICCGWTVYIELLANVTARPVINIDILLLPTEDLSLQQSVRFISMLVTVTSLIERTNITTPYIPWCALMATGRASVKTPAEPQCYTDFICIIVYCRNFNEKQKSVTKINERFTTYQMVRTADSSAKTRLSKASWLTLGHQHWYQSRHYAKLLVHSAISTCGSSVQNNTALLGVTVTVPE